jgi:hypothetical protein
MTNAAQCEKFHPFAVSALDRLRSRLSASLGTQQSAGAGCNSIQSSRGGPQGCGRVVAAWLRGIGKSCSPRDPFLRHRVGTFDAFLPCELGRRREATLVSAVGPFCAASGEDRASGYQTKIPFRVAATMATAASTNTERQAQTQIAASSASDLGMCFVPGSSSSWAKHYRSNQNRHEIPSQQSAMFAIRHLRRLQHLANGCPRWRKISGQPSQRPRCTISQAHQSALVTNGCEARLTRRHARWSRFCNPIKAGAFSVNSCATASNIGGPRQSTHASVRGLTRKISSSFCEAA